jgi:hypothetical protein
MAPYDISGIRKRTDETLNSPPSDEQVLRAQNSLPGKRRRTVLPRDVSNFFTDGSSLVEHHVARRAQYPGLDRANKCVAASRRDVSDHRVFQLGSPERIISHTSECTPR